MLEVQLGHKRCVASVSVSISVANRVRGAGRQTGHGTRDPDRETASYS